VLTTANELLSRPQANDDPVKDLKTYGTIYNPYVKRRKNYHPTVANKVAPTSELTSAPKSAEPPRPAPHSKPLANANQTPKPKPIGALASSFAKARPKPATKPASQDQKPGAVDEDGRLPRVLSLN
jgi:hypothetical protein